LYLQGGKTPEAFLLNRFGSALYWFSVGAGKSVAISANWLAITRTEVHEYTLRGIANPAGTSKDIEKLTLETRE